MLPSTAPAPLNRADPAAPAALAKPGTIPAAIIPPLTTIPPVLIKACPPKRAAVPRAPPPKRPAPPKNLPAPLAIRPIRPFILPLPGRLRRFLPSPPISTSIPSSSPPPKRPPIPFLIFLIMSPMRSKVFFISYFLTSLSSLLWSDLLTFSRSFMFCQLPIRPLTASLPAVIFSMSLSFLALILSAIEVFLNLSISALVLSLRSLTFWPASDSSKSVLAFSALPLNLFQRPLIPLPAALAKPDTASKGLPEL